MKEKGFVAYHSYLKTLEPLNDAEIGRLFRACLSYSMTGVTPDLRGNERLLFPTIREQIDRDAEKYLAKCEKQKENAQKRWINPDANACQRMPTHANACQRMPTHANDTNINENENANANKKNTPPKGSPPGGRRFNPPSVAEVKAYCKERGNGVDPEEFVGFYASKGWKVGKDPMKDWQAAVRTWERRRNEEQRVASPSAHGYLQRVYTDDELEHLAVSLD